ncbi:MAG: OmpW family protein [Zoogloea sp.]|nr:OmpW family protein [Zoogloea sp.]
MKCKLLVGLLAAAACVPAIAADDGPLMVRVRAVNINTANKSDAFYFNGPNIQAPIADGAVTVSDKTIPEVDISYFLTKNIAAELILTYPQKHDVSVAPVGKIGTVKELPPTLTLQYHFAPDATFRPYVGAGINYTRFSNVGLSVDGVPLQVKKNSFGLAVQAGADIQIDKNLFLNIDVKKVQMGTDVETTGGTKVTSIKIDPLLVGVGVGMHF